jgi:opacity protein-like surface antigen
MLVRRLGTALAAVLVAGLIFAPAAAAVGQPWNGRYNVVTYASQKNGTSVAARQLEGDLSAVYTFSTTCSTSGCVATVLDGPAPSNPTIPQPQRYTWNGSTWTFAYNWQWECFLGDGVPRVFSPAQSWVTYTPQADGTMQGSWYTDILGGPCRGNVLMPAAAFPAP